MEFLPQGATFEEATGYRLGADDASYAQKIEEWRRSAFMEAQRTAELDEEQQFVQRYVNYIKGVHWPENRPKYKSSFYTNRIGKARTDYLAHLTDARPIISVVPNISSSNAGYGEKEQSANIVANVIRSEWFRNEMDMDLIRAVDIAATCGTSFWRIGATFPGVMRVAAVGPESVLPIQPGFSIQNSTAVLYRTWKSVLEVKQRFGKLADGVERDAGAAMSNGVHYQKPPNYTQTAWNGLSVGFKRLIGRKVVGSEMVGQMFPTVEWQEYYIEDPRVNETGRPVIVRDANSDPDLHNWWYVAQPGQRLYPRKRLLIFAGKKLLYDGPSPYWHGLYPFAALRLNPVFWSFYGLSVYRDLIPLNEAINHVVAGIIDIIKKALNPPFIAQKNATDAAAWRRFFPDMPGDKLLINGQTQPNAAFKFLDPPNVPAFVFQMLTDFFGPEFEKQSGILDIASLTNKLQAPGGDTIEQMRDNMQAALRLQGRYIENFLNQAGMQAVSNVGQFYTLPTRLHMLGEDGITWSDMDYDPRKLMVPSDNSKYEFSKQFAFRVQPGSIHGGARDREKQMAVSLFAAQAIDREALLSSVDFPNGDKIAKRMADKEAAMAQAGAQPQQGGGGLRLTRGQRNGEAV